jgi:hypothetical protein
VEERQFDFQVYETPIHRRRQTYNNSFQVANGKDTTSASEILIRSDLAVLNIVILIIFLIRCSSIVDIRIGIAFKADLLTNK